METEFAPTELETRAQERLLDNLGLLLRNEAIYRSTSLRIRELATGIAQQVRSASGRRTLTVSLTDDGMLIATTLHQSRGPRREVATRLGGLNVRRIHFAPTVEPADLVAFAAVVNRETAVVNQARAVTANWQGLPASVVVEESMFLAGFGEADARFGLMPELDAVRDLLSPERLGGFLDQLGAIRESLSGSNTGCVMRRVDILETVVDRLSEVDKESPERAEALIEEALVRFRGLLGCMQEREVSPAFRGMVNEVAERFFPRAARDAREEPPEAGGRRWCEEQLPDSSGSTRQLREQLETFLAEASPPLEFSDPVPDASYLHIISRFLREDGSADVLRAAAEHVVTLLDQGKLAGFEAKIRKFVFSRLHVLEDHTPLNPLLYRLVGADEIAAMLRQFDLNNPVQVARFADMAQVVLPQAVAGLFRFLDGEDIDYQAGLLRRVLREVGRDAILAAGADLRDSPIFTESAFLQRLRRCRIAEVLPIVEVLYDARDAAMSLAGFTIARSYPFRCRAAFWLQAAGRASEVAPDYVHTVLDLEWQGSDDEALFARLLAQAQDDATHPDHWGFALRALTLANTDAAAETLIEICAARRWPFRPVHPQPMRDAARQALGQMTCKTAIDWNS